MEELYRSKITGCSQKKADTCNLINYFSVMRWVGASVEDTLEIQNFIAKQINLSRDK